MAFSTWTELKAAVADILNRTDLTTPIIDFIALGESEMQTKCKLTEAEAQSTVTITNGSGTLPAGFVGARSVYWDGSPDRPLTYLNPEMYDAMRASDSGDGFYYTITGTTIKTTPMGSGSIVMTAMIRFTPLSGSTASNTILANFPEAYLYGAAKHGAVYLGDDANAQKFGLLFNAACDRINLNNEERKYAGPLQVRAR